MKQCQYKSKVMIKLCHIYCLFAWSQCHCYNDSV